MSGLEFRIQAWDRLSSCALCILKSQLPHPPKWKHPKPGLEFRFRVYGLGFRVYGRLGSNPSVTPISAVANCTILSVQAGDVPCDRRRHKDSVAIQPGCNLVILVFSPRPSTPLCHPVSMSFFHLLLRRQL